MPLDLAELRNRFAFNVETEKLGLIRVWPATSTDAVTTIADQPRHKDESTRDCMLFLLSLTAAPEKVEDPQTQEELLSVEQLSSLSDDELEVIAGLFLQHHTYLFEDHSDINDVQPINLPRLGEESNTEYLRRLLTNYGKTQSEMLRRMTATLSDTMSKLAPDFLSLNLDFGISDSIDKAIESIRSSYKVGQDMAALNPAIVRPRPDPRHETNNLLAKLAEILSYHSNILTSHKQSNEEMAGSIRDLQEQARDWDKKSNRQWWVATIIAILALLVGVVFGLIPYLMSKPTP